MSTSKSVIYSLIIVTGFLFSNCSESTEPDVLSNDLIPLKISNSWNYEQTVYDSSGVISSVGNKSSTIIKDTTILSQLWYSFSDVPDGIWFTNKTDGYWAFVKADTISIINDTSLMVYKYPTKVGDIYGDANSPSEVVSIDEVISVPAGIFKVIHIITHYPSSQNYLLDSFEIFIAPKIGKIKVMQIGKKPNGNKFVVYKTELESYSLK
jgi:hypothetical protein